MTDHEDGPGEDGLSPERRELLELWLDRLEPDRRAAYVAPASELERALVVIWQDALDADRVGLDDDYFELGGDSIRAIIVLARTQDLGISLSVQDLFAARTIRELARRLQDEDEDDGASHLPSAAPVAVPRGWSGERPATAPESGMLFHALSDPRSYVAQATCLLSGDVDLPQLAQAWQLVADHRPELRRYFDFGTAGPVRCTAPLFTVPVVVGDLRSQPATEQTAELAHFLDEDGARGIDPLTAPLFRVAAFRTSDQSCRVVLTHHHLLLDGWSQQLVIADVLHAYRHLGEHPETEWQPEPAVRPGIDQTTTKDPGAAEDFWRRYLTGYAPRDSTPAPSPTAAGSAYDVVDLVLPQVADRELTRFGRRHGLTPGTLVTGGWALLISDLAASDDVTVGLTYSGRPPDQDGATEAIGMFVTTLPIRVRVPRGVPTTSWLRALQADMGEVQSHQFTPLNDIARAADIRPAGRLFDSIVVMENFPQHQMAAQDRIRVSDEDSTIQESYPLVLEVRPGSPTRLRIRYDLSRVPRARAHAMVQTLSDYLTAVADPGDVTGLRNRLADELGRHLDTVRRQDQASAARGLRTTRRRPVGPEPEATR